MKRTKKNNAQEGVIPSPNTDVDAVTQWLADVHEADTLAATDTSHLTARTNPRVMAHQMASLDQLHQDLIDREDDAERLRVQREHARKRAEVEQEDRWLRATADREKRAIAEGQSDAREAAEDLAAIRAWEREESPATAARRLVSIRRRRSVEFLAFSAVASALSALGVAALAHATLSWTTWLTAGAIGAGVEVILTLLVTRIIAHQAGLEQHNKARERVADGYPWVVVAGLVLASIVLNVAGLFAGTGLLGAIGIVGALVAALCAGMAWHANQSASEVIAANVKEFRGKAWSQHRATLRERAAGIHIPGQEQEHAHTESDPVIAAEDLQRLATEIAEQAAWRLTQHTGGCDAPVRHTFAPGATAALVDSIDVLLTRERDAVFAATAETASLDANSRDAVSAHASPTASDSDDADRDAPADAPPPAASHRRARRAAPPRREPVAAVTVAQVKAYFAQYPHASQRQAAEALGTSDATIRRRLRGQNHP